MESFSVDLWSDRYQTENLIQVKIKIKHIVLENSVGYT